MTHVIPNREALFAPFEQHFNKMFDKIFGDDSLQNLRDFSKTSYPKLDVVISDNRYIVEAAVPGVNPDELKVEILPFKEGHYNGRGGVTPSERKMLKISGKMGRDYQYSKSTEYAVKELKRSYFERSMLLPDDLEEDPEAVFDNGMLRLTWKMPEKKRSEKIKEIEIKKAN